MFFLAALPLLATLTTVAEQTRFARTGRYDEVVRLCAEFQRDFPTQVRCRPFGTTPEGRPMLSLVAHTGDESALDATEARRRGLPVVLAQGGIHAGEIDGKDAGLLLLRDLLQARPGSPLVGPLRDLVLVFVPVFNIDGHERVSPHNRPNQNGPAEMGFRTTAQNLNLNRDYVKAEAPEMAAMLRLLSEWDPLVYADLHVTDGADFQHGVSVTVEPRFSGAQPLRRIGRDLNAALIKHLSAAGHLPVDFYPAFEREDDPLSGFAMGVAPPRLSSGYWPLRNRFAVLVETHSWKDYPTRVRATRDALIACLHGLRFRPLPTEQKWPVQCFRVKEAKFHDAPYEGRQQVQVIGTWQPETRHLPAGSLFVPVAQRAGALVVHLLEPTAPDSLMSWGFFNATLEQKEYMEGYVAEQVAQELLDRDPALRDEFLRKLRSEPDFARDSAARLRFFYQHHPSWDERYRLYPVYRLDNPPP